MTGLRNPKKNWVPNGIPLAFVAPAASAPMRWHNWGYPIHLERKHNRFPNKELVRALEVAANSSCFMVLALEFWKHPKMNSFHSLPKKWPYWHAKILALWEKLRFYKCSWDFKVVILPSLPDLKKNSRIFEWAAFKTLGWHSIILGF